MNDFSSSPREMAASLWRAHPLIVSLAVREVFGRYRGSMLGLFWSPFSPVLMLAVYTFVFQVFFTTGLSRSATALPEEFRPILLFNPVTFVVDQTREIMQRGNSPDWQALAGVTVLAAIFAWLGFARFQKTRRGCADVL